MPKVHLGSRFSGLGVERPGCRGSRFELKLLMRDLGRILFFHVEFGVEEFLCRI